MESTEDLKQNEREYRVKQVGEKRAQVSETVSLPYKLFLRCPSAACSDSSCGQLRKGARDETCGRSQSKGGEGRAPRLERAVSARANPSQLRCWLSLTGLVPLGAPRL